MYKDTVYASGFVSIKQQELLDSQRVDRMIRAEGLVDTQQVLLDCGYDRAILTKYPIDLDELLRNELEKTIDFFEEFCSDEALRVACLKKFDYHNARVIMKSRYASTSLEKALYKQGIMEGESLRAAIEGGEYDVLPQPMREAIEEILSKEDAISGRDIDVLIEQAMYKDRQQSVRGIRSERIRRYFREEVDIRNILTAFRQRRTGVMADQYVEGGRISRESIELIKWGENGDITSEFSESEYAGSVERLVRKADSIEAVEAELYERLFELSCEGILNIFTTEPLFCWYVQKQEEMSTIRQIVVGKKNGMRESELKSRLRRIYR